MKYRILKIKHVVFTYFKLKCINELRKICYTKLLRNLERKSTLFNNCTHGGGVYNIMDYVSNII